MLQGIERKQETSQIKTTVTAMFHDSAVELSGQESFRVRMSVVPQSFLRGVSVAGCLIDQPSLSRNLTGKPAISARWLRLRLRRASLPQSKLFSAEARLAHSALRTPHSAFCGFSKVPAPTVGADAPRAQVGNQPIRNSMVSRSRYSRTSRVFTQCRPLSGLASHEPKNVAVRLSTACGPETNCCGTAVSHQI
jgi:hypothetical protein